ncbi:hypothetical protein L228DRAFT_250346 [Xylona heveae TC161]|uniref:Ubiquitin-like domain-containing protein n=1 Tax=Xylona heveae (strain CBS 132557 / TC161) TaxID=1328760 RepID=A0A161T9F0_XYLHT|nr:hypothetical protein L228DRAFT_250346 [Xylona heveae TC161]KZF19931.1 hypothetical protein L228DRAFT_250346 [Xylona heveae TC161]
MADEDTDKNSANIGSSTTTAAPLLLIIRFTTSAPDLPLPIISPHTATGLSVKQLIRAHLPADTRARRLRLIHAGRVLPDALPLTKTLKLTLPPPSISSLASSPSPSPSPTPSQVHQDSPSRSVSTSRLQNVLFGKSPTTSTPTATAGESTRGKEVAQEDGATEEEEEHKPLLQPTTPQHSQTQTPILTPATPAKNQHNQPIRFYIHCSVGEESLSPGELADEAAAAEASVKRITDESTLGGGDAEAHGDVKGKGVAGTGARGYVAGRTGIAAAGAEAETEAETDAVAPASTTAAPRGFDRLLGVGFSPAEVAALRSQFVALQSHSHTPDTMPSAAEMRMLEDRWMDESVAAGSGGGNAADTDDVQRGALEDMLLGNIMGFFWPIGAVVWLLREEGVWSRRRQIAVFTGMLANITFSILRVTS